MLKPRTMLLMTLSALAPASILIWKYDEEAFVLKARQEGFIFAWVEPGLLLLAMFYVGCIAFLLSIISMILDIRRSRF